MHSPRRNYDSPRKKIITSPLSLVKAVNKVLKNGSGIPENFSGLIESISDISKNGLKVCMLFILRGKHLDLVESFIELSIQNGNPLGIDLHANVPDYRKTLLEYSITSCNYEIFSKLLPHYEVSKDRGHIINHIIFSHSMSPVLTTSEIAVREQMLAECLKLGFKLSKETVKKLILTKNTDYLHIIAESEAGKKILTEDFLRKLDKILQLELANTRKIQEILQLIRERIFAIGPHIIKPRITDPSDIDFDMDNADITFPEIKNLDTLGLDVSTRVMQLTRK